MEKYGAFRDKGSGIAPFLQVPTQASGVALPFHIFLAVIRLPLLLGVSLTYFILFSWLPIGSLGKKAALWCILGTPGIWWVDLQVDGVKRGSLGQNSEKLPHPGSVLVSSYTSPIDALYLAAIFDPLFTRSFADSRRVQIISLWQAMLDAFGEGYISPAANSKLMTLSEVIEKYPDRCIAVFPECTTSNGRGILPLAQNLLSIPSKVKIFPVSLRYSPADITTPVPATYFTFLWNLCSKPTHCIRVRVAEATHNTRHIHPQKSPHRKHINNEDETQLLQSSDDDMAKILSHDEQAVLDKIAEALARLGRVKRVGLGVEDKVRFVNVRNKRK